MVGWPGGFHLPAPTDPGVTVSRHPALVTPGAQKPRVRHQWTNSLGYRVVIHSQLVSAFLNPRNRLYFLRIQRIGYYGPRSWGSASPRRW